jgi:hypothetical protein
MSKRGFKYPRSVPGREKQMGLEIIFIIGFPSLILLIYS